MLEFLLENGMRLSCLKEPPLQAFLAFGIATDNYPVDRAIRVAEVLVKNGASIDQRDSQGKSIFDVLDKAKSAASVAVLKEALTKMAIGAPAASEASTPPKVPATESYGPGSPDTSQPSPVPQGPTVQQWISLAERQFEHNNYQGALQSCDAALRIEPGNIGASQLKTKIQSTMSILGKN